MDFASRANGFGDRFRYDLRQYFTGRHVHFSTSDAHYIRRAGDDLHAADAFDAGESFVLPVQTGIERLSFLFNLSRYVISPSHSYAA